MAGNAHGDLTPGRAVRRGLARDRREAMSPQGRSRAARSILAVHPGALGDVVLFGHLLARLDGPVTLAAGGEKARLLHGLAVVDRALDFDALPMHEAFSDPPAPASLPRAGRCGRRADRPPADGALPGLLGRHDRLKSCLGGGRPAVGQLEGAATGGLEGPKAQMRLAAMCGAADAVLLPTRPPERFQGHLLDLWADLLAMPPRPPAPAAWPVPDSWADHARRLLAEAGIDPSRPYVLVHPGSGSPGKCWPAERFGALARAIAVETQAALVIGPVECERWGQQHARSLYEPLPVLVRPPLGPLAAALAAARLYVGNDSGVSHLAAAVGAPTLAIFGPTSPRHFAPVGPRVRVLSRLPLTDISAPDVLREAAGQAGWQPPPAPGDTTPRRR